MKTPSSERPAFGWFMKSPQTDPKSDPWRQKWLRKWLWLGLLINIQECARGSGVKEIPGGEQATKWSFPHQAPERPGCSHSPIPQDTPALWPHYSWLSEDTVRADAGENNTILQDSEMAWGLCCTGRSWGSRTVGRKEHLTRVPSTQRKHCTLEDRIKKKKKSKSSYSPLPNENLLALMNRERKVNLFWANPIGYMSLFDYLYEMKNL